MPTFSEAYLEAMAACPPSRRVFHTIEINHVSFDAPAYLVANVGDDMEFGLETGATVMMLACPFESAWPEQREGQPPSTAIKVDNVNREMVPKIRAALGFRAYVIATLRQYTSDDLTSPAFGPVEFQLMNIVMKGTTLTGTAVAKNLQNKRFPRLDKNYSYTQFSSLLP